MYAMGTEAFQNLKNVLLDLTLKSPLAASWGDVLS